MQRLCTDSICPNCSGSGEGQYEGTRCSSCKGSGVYKGMVDVDIPETPLVHKTTITAIDSSTTVEQAKAWSKELTKLYDDYYADCDTEWDWDDAQECDYTVLVALEAVVCGEDFETIKVVRGG
jgi:DnaJ-class molecular chaperone